MRCNEHISCVEAFSTAPFSSPTPFSTCFGTTSWQFNTPINISAPSETALLSCPSSHSCTLSSASCYAARILEVSIKRQMSIFAGIDPLFSGEHLCRPEIKSVSRITSKKRRARMRNRKIPMLIPNTDIVHRSI